MSSELFGTDGIRGPAGTYPLTSDGLEQIGRAVAACFTKPGDIVLVGWDPRESSAQLAAAAARGLAALGVDVRTVGVVPTPALAYLTKQQQTKVGVMITASHNPYTDNGVKVFKAGGIKLSDDDQAALNRLIDSSIEARQPGRVTESPQLLQEYEDFLVASAAGTSFDGLHLAVDTANGATSGLAARVFTRLGAHVEAMFDAPDGRNINVDCGATDTAALRRAVQEKSLSAGAAFDGDGDRVMLSESHGRELSGDRILYILAVAGGQDGVVATIMSNQGLETALKDRGIALHRVAVGDRSVLEGLEQTGYRLGGEQSGHIIIPQYSPTGDGLLAAIRTLSLAITSGKSLAQWYDELTLLPQAILSVPFADKTLLQRPEIQEFVEAQSTKLGTSGRLNVRPSGTEPKIRIMVEAPDADTRAREIAEALTKLADEVTGETK